ncbi:MAG: GGDEF domain-containing protein [Actinobacteria bacterium]|nr:GGDEF domain-containing protein [Actinomycetota bacterium]
MDASIRERLGLKAPSGPQGRDRAERALAARSLMYMFFAGGAIAAAALVSPMSHTVDDARIAVTAGCAGGIATVLFIGYDRLPRWALSVLLLCGSMLIEWAVWGSGDPSSPFLLFYLWVAFYAFYFLNRVYAALQVLFIGVAYAVVLAHSTAPFKTEVVRWVVFTVALVVSGLLVRMMRERIDSLLRSLDEAMRKDMLTGLLDERGFAEIAEKELERARRSGNRVGIVIAELDGPGEVRQRLGERRTDDVLATVATKIGGAIRLADEAALIEGERFAVICPYTDERGAAIMAERVGSIVREHFARAGSPQTLSFGVASYPKHGASLDAVMHAARHALGEAQQLGGDRAVMFFSAENSIEERLRGAEVDISVIVAEPSDVAGVDSV